MGPAEAQWPSSSAYCSRFVKEGGLSACRVFTGSFEPLQGSQHLFADVPTAHGLGEAAVAQIAQLPNGFPHLRECPLEFAFHLFDLGLDALAGFLDARVDRLQCMGLLAMAVAGELHNFSCARPSDRATHFCLHLQRYKVQPRDGRAVIVSSLPLALLLQRARLPDLVGNVGADGLDILVSQALQLLVEGLHSRVLALRLGQDLGELIQGQRVAERGGRKQEVAEQGGFLGRHGRGIVAVRCSL